MNRRACTYDGNGLAFGIEFAPGHASNNLLYLGVNGNSSNQLQQFQYTSTGISQTATWNIVNNPVGIGNMQLGSDGKIYASLLQTEKRLLIIDYPNVVGVGACTKNTILLSGVGGVSNGLQTMSYLCCLQPDTAPVFLYVNSYPFSNVLINATPDVHYRSDGFTSFARKYKTGRSVTLTAPQTVTIGPDEYYFHLWVKNGNILDIDYNIKTSLQMDANKNYTACFSNIAPESLTCSISVTPSNSTYTGGVPTNIYIGYGPQSATLNANASGGFTYSWSPTTDLSCSNCQSPVFTPTSEGDYTYTVTITNSNSMSTICFVDFCVKDIRAPKKNGNGNCNGNGNEKKVYLCHVPPGNPSNPQTLCISVNAVPAHLGLHGGDQLGKCGDLCNSVAPKNTENSNIAIDEQEYLEVLYAPNPFTSSFKLSYESSSEHEAIISLYGIMGNLIEKTTLSGYSNKIDLGKDMPPGIYTVSFIQGTNIKVFKIIKIDQ